MGLILQKNWRILGAAFLSVALVAGAYMFARSVESPLIAQASEESELLKAIASKDSDSDGLPDWEESLYGTDSHTNDTFNLGMTDGEAVSKGLIVPKAIADISAATSSPISYSADGLPTPPEEGTLTSVFAVNFFTLYLEAKQANGGADLSENDMANIANEAVNSLSSIAAIAPDFRFKKDLKIFGSGADAMKAFAVSAEAVLLKNTSSATKTPLGYLKDVLQKNDTTAFQHLSSLAKAYRDSAIGLAVLPVPEELAQVDLDLVNVLMRMSGIINDFTRVDTDPLAAILALQQYLEVAQSLETAFIDIGKIYKTAGIYLPDGAPGASFVNLIDDVANNQTGVAKP